MSAAGQSAGTEARRLQAQAAEHERLAIKARSMAERWMIAHHTERQVAGSLAPLTAAGYTFLHDRGWPGSRKAQVDHVLVGPGGLFIVDTKSWAEVEIAGGRIFRGQADVTDDLAGLADLAWGTEAVMAEHGLAPGEVHVVVVLANRNVPPTQVGSLIVVGERQAAKHINARGVRLTPVQTNTVLGIAMHHFPVLGEAPTKLDLSIPQPALAEADPEPLVTVEDVTEVLLAGLMAAPIEEWMAFLHPDQAKLVRRNFGGPSRIRGAAGTGKTVVGLHRAAYLARSQPNKILVTTFVSTLPAVLSSLLHRLAPEAVDRVEFAGVHSFARRLLSERGVQLNLAPKEADALFTALWQEHGAPGTLGRSDSHKQYWRDEISKVIKGRGLTTFEQYADLARTGRRRPLGVDQRRAVWHLFAAYEAGLKKRGIHDFDDLILQAEASLREAPLAGWGGVIIDEAQDLTCAMVRMLHLLVGDSPDGLTLIGDGQQSIYPGGFTLAEAGVSIAGRGVIMSSNYRNTREIAAFAAALVADDEFTDIEGLIGAGDRITNVSRSGEAPVSDRFASRQAHDAALVARVRGAGPLGDIGVLCLTTWGVAGALTALSAAGIPTVELTSYDGRSTNAVKVGTVKRAKGLEFKQVLVGRVPPALLDSPARGDEAKEIQRRELYVAMTRARDGLWVGVCA